MLDLAIHACSESGFAPWLCTMVMKGLELQETSCHTVEAIRVHGMCFRMLFVHESKSLVSLNQHAGNVLRTCDTLILDTYSDAKKCADWGDRSNGNLRKKTGELLQRLQVRQYKGRHTTASHNRPYEGKSSDDKWSFTSSYTTQGAASFDICHNV